MDSDNSYIMLFPGSRICPKTLTSWKTSGVFFARGFNKVDKTSPGGDQGSVIVRVTMTVTVTVSLGLGPMVMGMAVIRFMLVGRGPVPVMRHPWPYIGLLLYRWLGHPPAATLQVEIGCR